MSQESDVCCTTSMYDIQNRCIPDEIDLFYFKTCIITHNNNVIEQNINVSMFDILSVKEPHTFVSFCAICQAFSALTEAKKEDERKRATLLNFYEHTDVCLQSMDKKSSCPFGAEHREPQGKNRFPQTKSAEKI